MSSDLQHKEDEPNEPQLTLWAARGILLFIAAIWGTNFAVRLVGVLAWIFFFVYVSRQAVCQMIVSNARPVFFWSIHYVLTHLFFFAVRQVLERLVLSSSLQSSTE